MADVVWVSALTDLALVGRLGQRALKTWLPAALCALAVVPAGAQAKAPRLDVLPQADGSTLLQYTAAPGQANEVLLRTRAIEIDPAKRSLGFVDDTAVDFYDNGADAATFSSPLCTGQGTGMGCQIVGRNVRIRLVLGDGNDIVTPQFDSARLQPTSIDGGSGNDALRVRGTAPSSISFVGGSGIDFVDYFAPTNLPYKFSDDGRANDGLGDDNIGGDVELFIGGDGGDSFGFFGKTRHVVFGGGGSDTLYSGPGPELFDGGYGGDPAGVDAPSNDTVTYAGRDAGVTVTLDGLADDGVPGEHDEILPTVERVIGTSHADTLVGPASVPDNRVYTLQGGAGNDTIGGGAGRDAIYGGPGNDTVISLSGGKDAVDCGPGDDTAVADRSDLLIGCEHRASSYAVAIGRQKGGTVKAFVAVPSPNSWVQATLVAPRGVVKGSKKATTVGAISKRMAAGIRPLSIALNRAGRSALRKRGTLPLVLRAAVEVPGRGPLRASQRVTLRR
jgi:Ca2+-binding RTX toxin-like protein